MAHNSTLPTFQANVAGCRDPLCVWCVKLYISCIIHTDALSICDTHICIYLYKCKAFFALKSGCRCTRQPIFAFVVLNVWNMWMYGFGNVWELCFVSVCVFSPSSSSFYSYSQIHFIQCTKMQTCRKYTRTQTRLSRSFHSRRSIGVCVCVRVCTVVRLCFAIGRSISLALIHLEHIRTVRMPLCVAQTVRCSFLLLLLLHLYPSWDGTENDFFEFLFQLRLRHRTD